MKNKTIKCMQTGLWAALLLLSLSQCGPKCKTCHAEVMGVKTPEKELCGEELQKAEETTGIICK